MPNDCRRGDITSVDYVVNQTQVAKFEAKKQQFRSAISARKKSLGHETPLSKCKKHFSKIAKSSTVLRLIFYFCSPETLILNSQQDDWYFSLTAPGLIFYSHITETDILLSRHWDSYFTLTAPGLIFYSHITGTDILVSPLLDSYFTLTSLELIFNSHRSWTHILLSHHWDWYFTLTSLELIFYSNRCETPIFLATSQLCEFGSSPIGNLLI